MQNKERNRVIVYVNDRSKASLEVLTEQIATEKGYKVSQSQVIKDIIIKYLMERNETKCA